jgi:hypothetical protein
MKSNVSDHLELMEAIYLDATIKCIADVFDLRDLETIRSRVKHEGISFITIALPAFCSDFERSLASGFIDPTSFRNFRKNGPIPAFLQGMVGLVFDCKTGRILNDEPDNKKSSSTLGVRSLAVEAIRQICLSFKKLRIDCTLQRVQRTLRGFVESEQSFQEFSLSKEDEEAFASVSFVLWHNLISPIRIDRSWPKHGPGATAERVSGNQKFAWLRWHDRLEPYFPLISNGYPEGLPCDSKELKLVTFVSRDGEQPVRVVPVPKTLKGPRIIAIEPACMQYVQQGIRDILYKELESYWLTRGHINFRDQSINQRLAIKSSISGRLATIDLSDASDRVPRDLALEMFRSNPDLQEAIAACRSTKAQLPDGTIVSPLGKFASMGSALCFPVEAMYFYTICVIALLRAQSLPVSPESIFKVSRRLHVYGDDIIVPTTYAITVLDHLRKYNCKVNVNKTFLSGNFRESCGVDAYRGELVTPVYIRELRPENKRQPKRIMSWIATANLFYKKGYWRTATLMFNRIEMVVGPLPYVSADSPGFGRFSFLGYRSVERWNEKLQRFEVKALVPRPIYRTDKIEGYGALAKSLLNLEAKEASLSSQKDAERNQWDFVLSDLQSSNMDDLVSQDELHLERFALRGAVTLKLRWVPVH